MTVALDQKITVGPLQITVLSDCTTTTRHTNGSVFVSGQKRAVAILIKQGAALTAFAPEGKQMTREQVDNLCPSAWRIVLEAREIP